MANPYETPMRATSLTFTFEHGTVSRLCIATHCVMTGHPCSHGYTWMCPKVGEPRHKVSDLCRAEVQRLREEWDALAVGVEITHGEKDPGALAFRKCIGDLYSAADQY